MSSFIYAGTILTGIPANGVFGSGYPRHPMTTGTIGTPPYSIEAMALNERAYWRVKNWNVDADITAGSASVASGDMTPGGDNAVTELDLTDPQGGSHTFGIEGLGLNIFSGADFKKDGSDYYPAVDIIATVIDEDTGDQVYCRTQPAGLPDVPDGSITAFIDGKEITLYYKGYNTFNVGHLVIDPAEFWPYSP